MSIVRAVIKIPYKPARSLGIGNSLKDLQAIVGGYIEYSKIPNTNLTYIVNDDAIGNKLKPNVVNGNDTLYGTVLLVKFGDNGYVTEMNEEEVALALKICELSALDENGNWNRNNEILKLNKVGNKTSKLNL